MTTLQMPRIVQVVISGPINERWHATPMRDDGTAGNGIAFHTLDAARQFAESNFPRVPVRVSKRKPEVPRKCRRILLYRVREQH